MSHAARAAEAMEAREAQPDMFVQALLDDARAAVVAATEVREQAEFKLRRAPHGTYRDRLKTFGDATHALLIAEGKLARLLREARR